MAATFSVAQRDAVEAELEKARRLDPSCEEFFSADPAGFPGYVCFLLLTAIVPSVVLFRTVKYFIKMLSSTSDCIIFLYLGMALARNPLIGIQS